MPAYRYSTPDYTHRGSGHSRSSMPPCSSAPATPCCREQTASDTLKSLPLAMAYIPWQQWRSLYEAEKGFCLGTIFAELDMPFHGKGGCCR